jgi:hypothetical protein
MMQNQQAMMQNPMLMKAQQRVKQITNLIEARKISLDCRND